MNAIPDRDLVFAVLISTAVFLILVAFSVSYFIIYKRKRRKHVMEMDAFKIQFRNEMLQSQVEVQEQTFQVIGKELHDNVGQLLSTARMLLGLTERNLPQPPDTLLTANETIAQAISELRSLSKSLDRDWLERFDFNQNMQMEMQRINAAGQIQLSYFNEHTLTIDAGKQIILFRIVQEAMQNAIKHAEAESITVKVVSNADHILILVSDNGKGFEPAEGDGMGLVNMRQRTALLNGQIRWISEPGKGADVEITLPNKLQE